MKPHILIIFTIFVFSAACNSSKQTSLPIEITAEQLIEDYNKNPLTSKEKYEGKTLIVTGTISHYGQINGIVGVYLKDKSVNEWNVVCLIDKSSQPEVYSKLKQGESRTFEGVDERKKDEHQIFLMNCKMK